MNIADLDLRDAILHNMRGASEEDVRHTIVDAISSREEKLLPGLGVLFELAWGQMSEQDKNKMIQVIQKQVQ
ncbi:small acid-soluble spore protein SspI [Aneurinibacillus sp. Ricciae_BoGa-3]|uniref:small acid-soluble spore protein SspI n=1 Tax=Aneurinibacillus sp. Ricciae_BoGa-3 TaxID=3022697 RepID=UPI002341E4A0|nr:small acid-soluble spore protein SspI [Aneurinibacillus sp. Ricciae_BoGa-3]WCK53751.1 small acid-soluble spore protein SspI [Aneurinibacillus sp. Ricciae_BoGa-3]